MLLAMAQNFCVWGSKCQSHGLNAMWTTPAGTKKSERLWNNIIRTNLNYSAIFFSITVELKAREEPQMLSTALYKAFDTAPTTSFSLNCRDKYLMDALFSGWGLAGWLHPERSGQGLNVPVETSDKCCPTVQLSLVGLLSYLKRACAQILPQNIYSESNGM